LYAAAVIVAIIFSIFMMKMFQDDQITEGRFNNYGNDPVPVTTTIPEPEPKYVAPDPPPPPEPKYVAPKEPKAPTPFETGKKVRAPYGCEEGYDERGVDCK
jgi:hypothetical protein